MAPSVAPREQEVDLIWGPLSAALLLFAVPGCLLGTVTPFAIKLLSLRTQNEKVGTSAGTVSMLSTVGSVLGTFGTGFFLIPSLGIKSIFLAVGLSLAAVAAIGYLMLGSWRGSTLVLLCAAVLGMRVNMTEQPVSREVVFQQDTFYHQLSVLRKTAPDGRGVSFLLADGAAQGAQADSGERLVYGYNRYYRLEQVFCPSMKRALFLGGGAYAIPEALADDHPGALVDVVEIDPEIEKIGRRFFRLDEYEGRVRPLIGDARIFLSATEEQYDLIFGDVFRGRRTVPPHLVTREFFDLVQRRLNDGGIYMMNLLSALEGPKSRFFSSVAATVRDVFPELYVFAVHPNIAASRPQNLILVAPKTARRLTRDDLVVAAENLVESYDVSTVLTDDYNPVEYIIAKQLRD